MQNKELEEAINNVKELIEEFYYFPNPKSISIGYEVEEIETVLKELERLQKEIEFQKDINKTEQNRHKKTEKSLKEQLEKKGKIIDLMAFDIYGMQIECNRYFKDTEEVKQYFEKRVEEEWIC